MERIHHSSKQLEMKIKLVLVFLRYLYLILNPNFFTKTKRTRKKRLVTKSVNFKWQTKLISNAKQNQL